MRRFTCLLLVASLNWGRVQAQVAGPEPLPPDTGIHQGRFIGVVAGTAVVYALTTYFLGKTWYTKRVPFHSFNDNGEWLQMDKVGHATTAYAIGRGEYELFRWSGVNERASVLTGGLIALLYQTTIEVFDGRSEGWGFSKGDMAANLTGGSAVYGAAVRFRRAESKLALRLASEYLPFLPAQFARKNCW